MGTDVANRAGEKFVRDLLTKGRPVQFVADASGWAPSRVQAVADELAVDQATAPPSVTLPESGPATVVPRPGPAAVDARPPTSTGITIEALVAAAARSSSKRIKSVGEKLSTTAAQLRELLAEERQREQTAARKKEEAEAAAEKIRVLEKELAEARAALRGGRARARTLSAVDHTPRGDSKAVRAWAADNGVACPAVGRVPKQVIEAYTAAQAKAS